MKRIFLILSILFWSVTCVHAQQPDSIVFKNGNIIVGEVKAMDRNILKIETDYSDEDFAIEWNGIKEIYTKTYFLITLSNGTRYNGHLKSVEPGKVMILTDDGN